jgi:DNA-binding NtrC family response regulator
MMRKEPIKIVVIEQGKTIFEQVQKIFTAQNIDLRFSEDLSEFLPELLSQHVDILLLTADIFRAQKESQLSALEKIALQRPKTQIIFLVAEDQIHLANQILKAGAYHYARLPVSNEELKLLIESALHNQPKIANESSAEMGSRNRLGEIIGSSAVMQRVYEQIIQAAKADIPVLLLGETGTGKDLVAQTIHRMSERSEYPYLAVNLGALPNPLVASELFGHEKGAFTGASKQHIGVFEQGSNGTVLLDEIDTIDEKIQVSLLRLIEQKRFTRLGGRKDIQSHARLISASNGDLEELIELGSFRSDLFYRLDVFRITLPALRDHISDIPLLLEELLVKYNLIYKRNITGVSDDCLDALMNFEWPGNIREFKNAVQRAVLVCDDTKLQIEHLPPRFHASRDDHQKVSFKIGTPLHEIERDMIVRTLAATNNNRKKTAELLGISRRALYNKLDKYNL